MVLPETQTEYTEAEVAEHNTRSDCWIMVGNDKNGGSKVYDVTSYLDDHPGGGEVIADVAGKDADSMFEDIGHSAAARKIMAKYLKGTVKVDPEAAERKRQEKEKAKEQEKEVRKGGLNPLAILALLVVILAYFYMQQQQKASA